MSNWRIGRKLTALITQGTKVSVDINTDVNSGKPPVSCMIRNIIVHPAAATIFAFRIFSKESRISDPSNENYSLVRQFEWGPDDTVSAEPLQIASAIPYFDENARAGTNYEGTIWCEIEIKGGSVNSVFSVAVTFDD